MPKQINTKTENPGQENNEMKDLESFIQKKKIQNNALKKIIERLNSAEAKK